MTRDLPMSLVALLEGCKDVAIATRDERAAKCAQEDCEFEAYGADLAAAYEDQELVECEEALRLGLQLDEEEEAAASAREAGDLKLAREMLAADEAHDAALSKDELIASQLEERMRSEAKSVAALEKRMQAQSNRKLCKEDLRVAEQLAWDIEQEEARLSEVERKDRRLARQLVKEEGKVLATLPQTEEKLRHMSRTINGDEPAPLRTRLRAKLLGMRKVMSDMTNKIEGDANAKQPIAA